MIKREGIKYELKVCGILKIGTGKANDDVRLDDEEVGRLIYERIFPEIIKDSEWSLKDERDERKKREQHKELLAVARFGSDDALVMGRIEGFCKAVGFPEMGKFWENVRRIDMQTPLEPRSSPSSPRRPSWRERCRKAFGSLSPLAEERWSPQIFITAGTTSEILCLLKDPKSWVKAAAELRPLLLWPHARLHKPGIGEASSPPTRSPRDPI